MNSKKNCSNIKKSNKKPALVKGASADVDHAEKEAREAFLQKREIENQIKAVQNKINAYNKREKEFNFKQRRKLADGQRSVGSIGRRNWGVGSSEKRRCWKSRQRKPTQLEQRVVIF